MSAGAMQAADQQLLPGRDFQLSLEMSTEISRVECFALVRRNIDKRKALAGVHTVQTHMSGAGEPSRVADPYCLVHDMIEL